MRSHNQSFLPDDSDESGLHVLACSSEEMSDNGSSNRLTIIFAPLPPVEASESTVLEGISPKILPTNDITLPIAPDEPEEENRPIPHNKSLTTNPSHLCHTSRLMLYLSLLTSKLVEILCERSAVCGIIPPCEQS